jgi:hypothetical protein
MSHSNLLETLSILKTIINNFLIDHALEIDEWYMGSIELLEFYLELLLVLLESTSRRIGWDFPKIRSVFSEYFGYFSSKEGLFLKKQPVKSIELVQIYLDSHCIRSGPLPRRIWRGFSEFLPVFRQYFGFSLWRKRLEKKVNRLFERARRVLSWSILSALWSTCCAKLSWKYSNPTKRYPTYS